MFNEIYCDSEFYAIDIKPAKNVLETKHFGLESSISILRNKILSVDLGMLALIIE